MKPFKFKVKVNFTGRVLVQTNTFQDVLDAIKLFKDSGTGLLDLVIDGRVVDSFRAI